MKSTASEYTVRLDEVSAEAGWGVEAAVQRLRIVVGADWAGRPAVSALDASRLLAAARLDHQECLRSQPSWEDEREAVRAAYREAAERRKTRILGPAGGIASTDIPG